MHDVVDAEALKRAIDGGIGSGRSGSEVGDAGCGAWKEGDGGRAKWGDGHQRAARTPCAACEAAMQTIHAIPSANTQLL